MKNYNLEITNKEKTSKWKEDFLNDITEINRQINSKNKDKISEDFLNDITGSKFQSNSKNKDELSENFYHVLSSKNSYKGTSIKISKWKLNTVYYCDEYINDLVYYNNSILVCVKNHESSEDNKPIFIINGQEVQLKDTTYWNIAILGTDLNKAKADIENITTVENQQNANASVNLVGDTFRFSFALPKGLNGTNGKDGANGKDGKDGINGSNGINGVDGKDGKDGKDGIGINGNSSFIIFKSTSQEEDPSKTPFTPTGGYWNLETNIFTPPAGWQPNSSTLKHPIWMSSALFDDSGHLLGNWSEPIVITGADGVPGLNGEKGKDGIDGQDGAPGKDGNNGINGSSIQFAYRLVEKETINLAKPNHTPNDDFTITDPNWSNNALEVTKDLKYEYVSIAIKKPGAKDWDEWSNPTLWSVFGVVGTDGDGVKYAFRTLNVYPYPKDQYPTGTGKDVEYPIDWTDEPSGVGETSKYEYVSTSKYNGKDKNWSNWSIPSLWTRFAENGAPGKDGTSVTIKGSVETAADLNTIQDVKPGDGWITNNDGHLHVFSGVQFNDVGPVRGPQGEKGDQGDPGQQGKPGQPGQNGKDGIDGQNGKDGTNGGSIQFAFTVTQNEKTIPDPIKPSEIANDFYTLPEGIWKNNAIGVNKENQAEWVSIAFKPTNGIWGEWSNASLWSVYGKNGTDGDGIKYAFLPLNTATPPAKPSGTGADGEYPSGWYDNPQELTDTNKWQFVTTSVFKLHPEETKKRWSEWSQPTLWNVYSGDYKTYIYKISENAPQKPSIDKLLPDGWNDYPVGEGRWWQCIGTVNGITNKVKTWSNPLLVNGQDGLQGDAGNFTEIRFCKGNEENPDSELIVSERNPIGWTKIPPQINIKNGEHLWQTVAEINPNLSEEGNLVNNWSDPIKISGENGKDGIDGQDGIDGTDGKDGTMLYPAGNWNSETIYTRTITTTPYVIYNENYYILLINSSKNNIPDQSPEIWELCTKIETVFAKIGIIDKGLIGSAVFSGDYMFSQYGVENTGVKSLNYIKFNPTDFELPLKSRELDESGECAPDSTIGLYLSDKNLNLSKLEDIIRKPFESVLIPWGTFEVDFTSRDSWIYSLPFIINGDTKPYPIKLKFRRDIKTNIDSSLNKYENKELYVYFAIGKIKSGLNNYPLIGNNKNIEAVLNLNEYIDGELAINIFVSERERTPEFKDEGWQKLNLPDICSTEKINKNYAKNQELKCTHDSFTGNNYMSLYCFPLQRKIPNFKPEVIINYKTGQTKFGEIYVDEVHEFNPEVINTKNLNTDVLKTKKLIVPYTEEGVDNRATSYSKASFISPNNIIFVGNQTAPDVYYILDPLKFNKHNRNFQTNVEYTIINATYAGQIRKIHIRFGQIVLPIISSSTIGWDPDLDDLVLLSGSVIKYVITNDGRICLTSISPGITYDSGIAYVAADGNNK